jgi:spore coat protein B
MSECEGDYVTMIVNHELISYMGFHIRSVGLVVKRDNQDDKKDQKDDNKFE